MRDYDVGTFYDPNGSNMACKFTAYLRDYNPSWSGCLILKVAANSGKEAVKKAIEARKALVCMTNKGECDMGKFQSKVAVNSSVQVGKDTKVMEKQKILKTPVTSDGCVVKVGYGTTLSKNYNSVRVDCGVEYPTTKDKIKEAYAAAWDLVAEEFNTQLEDAKEFLKTL